MGNKKSTDKNQAFRKKNDLGVPIIIGLFVLAIILGVVVFRNYVLAEKNVTAAISQVKIEAPSLTIEQCAQKNMEWYLHCDTMQQICDDTVSRMMKVCLVNGDKIAQCASYGKEIYGYNFGAIQCRPYLKNRSHKKACADTWQTIADFCKATLGKQVK